MSARPDADPCTALDAAAHELRKLQPLAGQFLIAAIGMCRSGELAPRQLAHATLTVANRLPDEWTVRDQLRAAVQDILPVRRASDEPDYSRPLTFRRGEE